MSCMPFFQSRKNLARETVDRSVRRKKRSASADSHVSTEWIIDRTGSNGKSRLPKDQNLGRISHTFRRVVEKCEKSGQDALRGTRGKRRQTAKRGLCDYPVLLQGKTLPPHIPDCGQPQDSGHYSHTIPTVAVGNRVRYRCNPGIIPPGIGSTKMGPIGLGDSPWDITGGRIALPAARADS